MSEAKSPKSGETTTKKTKKCELFLPLGKTVLFKNLPSYSASKQHAYHPGACLLHHLRSLNVGFSQNTTNLRQHLNYYHLGLLPKGSGSQAKQTAKQSTLGSLSKPRTKLSVV